MTQKIYGGDASGVMLLKRTSTTDLSAIISEILKWVRSKYQDDIYEELALAAIHNCIKYDSYVNDFRRYCFRSAVNACNAYMPSYYSSLDNLQLRKCDFEELISGLPEVSREICRLRFKHDMTFLEIGNNFGKTEGWARYKLADALHRLRKESICI